tara:strand:+ start:1201 stop:1899 length:699 start_codon:yes stop_codon:yes gene_type:complete
MKGPKNDDIFDILANVSTLNLYNDPEGAIYNQGAAEKLYKLLLSQASALSVVDAKTIELAMDQIAWHESRGRSRAVQKSHKFDSQGNKMRDAQGNYIFIDGPGRGLYQYELQDKGGSGAARTALRRLYNRLGGDLVKGERPDQMLEFMQNYFPENKWGHHDMDIPGAEVDIDFSQLSEIEQKVLFLADKLEEGIDFSDIGTDTAQWWLDHHKKSGDSTAAFDESMTTYKQQE